MSEVDGSAALGAGVPVVRTEGSKKADGDCATHDCTCAGCLASGARAGE